MIKGRDRVMRGSRFGYLCGPKKKEKKNTYQKTNKQTNSVFDINDSPKRRHVHANSKCNKTNKISTCISLLILAKLLKHFFEFIIKLRKQC